MNPKRAIIAGFFFALALSGAAAWVAWHAKQDQPAPLRLAYQNRIGSALCIVAVEKGYFAHERVSVRTMRFDNGPACGEALYSGAADVADLGDTPALILASRGAPFSVIASIGAGENRHRLMVKADSPLKTPSDIVGKRIAVKKGTSSYGGFLAFLAAKGIDRNDLTIVDLQPSEMVVALQAGSVDGFVASEPTPSSAEKKGMKELATMGGLGNVYPLMMMARNDAMDSRGEDIRKLTRALRRAEIFIHENPQEAAELIGRATGLDQQTAARSMSMHDLRLNLDESTMESLRKTAVFLKEQGQIENLPDLASATKGEFLPAK